MVAPLLDLLLSARRVDPDAVPADELDRRLGWLSAFAADQPDVRLRHMPIRHWDGYWFGGLRMWGDVFPHYWSILSAAIYLGLAGRPRRAGTHRRVALRRLRDPAQQLDLLQSRRLRHLRVHLPELRQRPTRVPCGSAGQRPGLGPGLRHAARPRPDLAAPRPEWSLASTCRTFDRLRTRPSMARAPRRRARLHMLVPSE